VAVGTCATGISEGVRFSRSVVIGEPHPFHLPRRRRSTRVPSCRGARAEQHHRLPLIRPGAPRPRRW
jgi:hypothetical protein